MKKRVFLNLAMACLLTSCGSFSQPTPTPSAPPPSPTSTLPSTATLTLTPTPYPAETVAFFRIRITFSTTSDWSTLAVLGTDNILSIRVMNLSGAPIGLHTGMERLSLGQPLEAAGAGQEVGVTVDYAIAPQSLDQPLDFLLKKGDLNASSVEISSVSGEAVEPIETIRHTGIVGNAGVNPKRFSIDLSALKGTLPHLAQVKPPATEKLVWTFYYMWYTLSDWSSPWLMDWPTVRYASSDTAAITRQVKEAQSAGIDGFISSWWGPGSDTNQNLRKLLPVAQEHGFRVSIYFETLAGPDGSPISENSIYDWLAYAIQQYGNDPAFMRVERKPLIVIWASAAVPLDAWGRVFTKLRANRLDAVYLAMGYDVGNLDVFDGLHDYGVFFYPDLEKRDLDASRLVRNYSLLADDPTPKIWVATVQPGYDDTLQPSRQGMVQDRQNGDVYRSTWEAAMASEPDWIFITSWNEWYEHTHIEPGILYADLYLQITREYAEQWKN